MTTLESDILLDPRAVAPLVFLLRDPDPGVREAAARQLGRMPPQLPPDPPLDPRVERTLRAVAQNKLEEPTVRVAAIESLRVVGGPDAANALRELYVTHDQPAPVRDAARAALAARWPEELAKKTPVTVDRSGRQGLVAGATLLGSYTLGAIGALGKNEAGTAIGILGGAVTGGVTAAYLTRSGEVTKAQASWLVSGGIWGATLGMTAAAAMQREPDHRFVLSLGLIGEGLGLGTTFATRRGLRYSASDIGETNALGVLAVDLAFGGLLLDMPDDHRVSFGVVTAASTIGLAAGLALSPQIELSKNDSALVTLAAYEGTVLGALAPSAWFSPVDDGNHQAAGTLLGLGTGILAGAAYAQIVEVPQRDIGLIWLFGSYGKLLGYSIPLLTAADAIPADTRGVFLGSLAGLAGGAALAPELEFRGGDAGLIALGTGLGGWHGLGLGIAAGIEDRPLGGWFTLGTSLGGLGTMALTRAVKVDNIDVQAMAGGFFWGTWFSAWGAALKDVELEPALRVTIAAGDAGLAVGALLVSPAVDLDPRRVGVAYLGGLSGAALGSLGAALATRDNDKLIGANLIGSVAGLAIGGLIASQMRFSPRPPRGTASAPVAPSSRGLSLGTPLLSPIVLAPPSGSTAMPGIGIAASFVEN